MKPCEKFFRERKQSFLSESSLAQQSAILGRFFSWHIVSKKILSCEKLEVHLYRWEKESMSQTCTRGEVTSQSNGFMPLEKLVPGLCNDKSLLGRFATLEA